jgi:beta-lactamase class A
MGRWRLPGLFVVVLALSGGLHAGEFEGEQAVREAARGLLPCFAATPANLRERFVPGFLKSIQPLDIVDIFRSLHKEHGKPGEYRLRRMTAPYKAEVEFVFEGVRLPARLGIDPRPPHLITGLEFGDEIADRETLVDIVKDLKALPGEVGFSLRELGDKPQAAWEYHSDRPLAVASSMKLLVLAALADEIGQKKRSWSDVVPVRRAWASLPAGVVQDWPDGSPVTLHTLATLMVSRSDNTAADHLIRLLGRERVEAMQDTLGLQAARRNRPFLCTAEMFKLKLVMTPEAQKEYVDADADQRRRLLESKVAAQSLEKHRGLGAPQLINEVEWFFSPADMCRILDWLGKQGPEVRDMLAINRGLSLDESHWTYIGYKGGAEPGVLNFSALLQDRHGRWFAFVIGWNNPKADVDRTPLVVLSQRLVRLAQKSERPPKAGE